MSTYKKGTLASPFLFKPEARSVLDGGGSPKVVEPPVIVKRSHSVQWKREVFDLDQKKLATLKALHGWTNVDLALHFEVSQTTIKTNLYGLDRTGNHVKSKG